MAEFNPFLPQANIPNWTDAPGRLIDGSGFGEIFANVAETTGKVVAAENVRKRTNELRAGADAAGDEGHLEGFATAAGVPLEVARGMSKPELWKKAFEKGNYSDSFFYTKMDTWAKEMKAKYPNYAEEIDQQTARVMGRTPANALYSEMQQNYNDLLTAQRAAQKDDLKFVEDHTEFLDPTVVANWGKLTDEQKGYFKSNALIAKGEDARFKQNIARLEANAKAGALDAAPVLSQGISGLQRNFWTGATDAAGGSYGNLKTTIRKLAEGGFTPEELTQVNTIVQQRKEKLLSDWNVLITTPDKSGKTLQDYFANDPSAWNAQKAKIDDMVKGLDDLAQGKTGYVEWNSTVAEAAKDERTRKLEDTLGKDTIDGLKGLQDVLGQANYDLMLGKALQGNDGLQDVLNGYITGLTAKYKDIGQASKKVADNADPSLKPVIDKAVRNEVESRINLATDSKIPLAGRKDSLAAIFNDKDNTFIRSLKDTPDNTGMSSREKFYTRMLTPEVAKAAADLGMGKEYTAWLKQTGVTLLAGNVEQVNASNKSTKYMDISFNPETMQWQAKMSSLVTNPQQVAKYISARKAGQTHGAFANIPRDIPIEDLDAMKYGLDSVQKMNMVVKGLTQAIRAEKPGITDEQLSAELQKYFTDVQSTYQKEDYWQVTALKALGTYIADTVTGKTAARNNEVLTKGIQKIEMGDDFGVIPTSDTNFVNSDGVAVSTTGTVPDTGDSTADSILAMIHGAEGADYNTVYGGGKVNAGGMTVQDVLNRTENAGSSAFGAVQVMKKTLKGLVRNGVVRLDQVMNQPLQDKIGLALMKEAGYDDWKAGKLSVDQFADRLANIWASLPLSDGKSKYESDGVNKARISRDSFVQQLYALQ